MKLDNDTIFFIVLAVCVTIMVVASIIAGAISN